MKYLLSLALVTGIVAANGQKPAPAAKMVCAVSKEPVDIATATKTKKFADYKGRRYFFCCDDCPAAFKKDPAKFAKSPSIPTPKPVKK